MLISFLCAHRMLHLTFLNLSAAFLWMLFFNKVTDLLVLEHAIYQIL